MNEYYYYLFYSLCGRRNASHECVWRWNIFVHLYSSSKKPITQIGYFLFLHFTRCQSIPCLKWWHCLVNTFDLTWPDFSINLLFCLQFSIEKVPWFHLILNFVAVTELWVQCTRARRDCHQICTWHLKTFWCWNYKKIFDKSCRLWKRWTLKRGRLSIFKTSLRCRCSYKSCGQNTLQL